MAQHSNYAQDRDLMMEAYGSVEGIVPKTSSTALPRGYVLKESSCNSEHEEHRHPAEDGSCASDEEKITKVELGGKVFEIGSDDPNDDGIVIEIEKHANGYFITGGVYSDPEDYVTDPENPREGYGYALTLDGQPMDEDDLATAADFAKIDQDLSNGMGKSELEAAYGAEIVAAYIADGEAKGKFEGEMEDAEDAETRLGATNEFPDGEGKYEVAAVGGMHGQSIMRGKKFNSLADACAHAGCDPSEITSEEWIDMEGDGTTLEFMVDEDTAIVMHKDVSTEDAEGEHSPIQACTAAIDELAATLQGDEKLAVFEDLRDYLSARLGRTEDAEGHHSSGSDDGECDECGGDGCDVCHGTGEQDEEEVVAESYTTHYLK